MATEILVQPVISEKMTGLGEKLNRVAFIVNKKANKIEIKSAVESMYGVKVAAVNTMVNVGKKKSRFTRGGVIAGKTGSFKKAIITLAEGETIDFYSNI